ncbi:hypothetical protein [Thioalkalivibrio sp. ALE16]|uniref:hypothetical protein n=1 Tax=Thioalkalivibrio sp. ALE16 TaxID=1158172 RepID=UPI000381B5A5|nr:hypothetical protein [Thioalkalivibrio sp. ALE16]
MNDSIWGYVKVASYGILLVTLSLSMGEPPKGFAQDTYNLVLQIGIPVYMATVIFASAIKIVISGSYQPGNGLAPLVDGIYSLARGVMFLVIALWMVSHFGDDLYRVALEDPQGAASFALAITILFGALLVSRVIGPHPGVTKGGKTITDYPYPRGYMVSGKTSKADDHQDGS